MNIQNILKKEGINISYELSKSQIQSIADNVANRLVCTFPMLYLDEDVIKNRLYKLRMYKAKMPEGMAEAKYFYKNTSIYFNENIDDNDLEEFAIHECIHYLQEIKEGNKLIRMGLRQNRN